jgi:hypothetical protein
MPWISRHGLQALNCRLNCHCSSSWHKLSHFHQLINAHVNCIKPSFSRCTLYIQNPIFLQEFLRVAMFLLDLVAWVLLRWQTSQDPRIVRHPLYWFGHQEWVWTFFKGPQNTHVPTIQRIMMPFEYLAFAQRLGLYVWFTQCQIDELH